MLRLPEPLAWMWNKVAIFGVCLLMQVVPDKNLGE